MGLNIVDIDKSLKLQDCLRICAKKVNNLQVEKNININDRMAMYEIVQSYALEKIKFKQKIIERLSKTLEEWRNNNFKIGIYGAGIHTRFLMEIFEFGNEVTCILDSDDKKWGSNFIHWYIYGPKDIHMLKLDAILISSYKFEQEIYDSIKHLKEFGIKITGCYNI